MAETLSFTGTLSTNGRDPKLYWDPKYKWQRPSVQILVPSLKGLGPDFCFCIEEEENRTRAPSIRNAHFPGGGPFLRCQEGPNGHSSAPTATVTLWAAAAMETQVRLTHFVRL